nr:hypothetical protein [Nitrosomonas nitrosa]
MSRSRATARVTDAPRDGVRRETYERSMALLRGRVGFFDSLNAEQIRVVVTYTGPETVGANEPEAGAPASEPQPDRR